jgi:hypothetical protein
MTITRVLFYATLATCPLWAGVVTAHPTPDGTPAAAASVAAAAAPTKPAPHVATKPSQVDAKSPRKRASSPEASAGEPYHLSHTPHRLDSYQNAVTPPPATNER